MKISLPKQDKTFEGRVSSTLPQFDAATRTLKVRLEAANPHYVLKPDMFVDVEIPVAYPPAITVPVDAVMDSGLKKTVFVDRGDGFFEPREVETGARYGERVEIIRGISESERIVVSGNFLIDSESRMQLAASGLYGTLAKDPACGRDVSVRKAERGASRAYTTAGLGTLSPQSARSVSTGSPGATPCGRPPVLPEHREDRAGGMINRIIDFSVQHTGSSSSLSPFSA